MVRTSRWHRRALLFAALLSLAAAPLAVPALVTSATTATKTGETDVNPGYSVFSDAELAITGATTPPTSAPPTSTAAPTTAVPTTSRPPVTTAALTSAAPGTRTCAAAYKIVGSWQGGFQGEVTVTAGGTAITGWTVTWTYANGQAITQFWGAALTSSGAAVTAQPAAWNGSLAAGGATTFGFLANSGATNAVPALTCTAR